MGCEHGALEADRLLLAGGHERHIVLPGMGDGALFPQVLNELLAAGELPLGNGSAEQALQFIPDCPVTGLLAHLGCRFFQRQHQGFKARADKLERGRKREQPRPVNNPGLARVSNKKAQLNSCLTSPGGDAGSTADHRAVELDKEKSP